MHKSRFFRPSLGSSHPGDPRATTGTLARSPRARTHRSPIPRLCAPAIVSDLRGWHPRLACGVWLSVATPLNCPQLGLSHRPPLCPAQGCSSLRCFPPGLWGTPGRKPHALPPHPWWPPRPGISVTLLCVTSWTQILLVSFTESFYSKALGSYKTLKADVQPVGCA